MDNSHCVVLVPVAEHIQPHCELSLRQLELRGYVVRRWYGDARIDHCRSRLATSALVDGFEELMWVDADIAFDPVMVDRLRAHDLPIVCGLYPTKVECQPSWVTLPGQVMPRFGSEGGLVELRYAPAGFLYTRREVYQAVRQQLRLPICNARSAQPVVPYFLPVILGDEQEHFYLGEDFAFCERARQCGYRVFGDTTIRLQHIGIYGYSYENMRAPS